MMWSPLLRSRVFSGILICVVRTTSFVVSLLENVRSHLQFTTRASTFYKKWVIVSSCNKLNARLGIYSSLAYIVKICWLIRSAGKESWSTGLMV